MKHQSEMIPVMGYAEQLKRKKRMISLIKSHPVLYDHSNGGLNSNKKNRAIWENISNQVGMTVSELKKSWRALRQGFSTYLKAKSDTTKMPYKRHWCLKEDMEFLRPFMKKKKKSKNDDNLDEALCSGFESTVNLLDFYGTAISENTASPNVPCTRSSKTVEDNTASPNAPCTRSSKRKSKVHNKSKVDDHEIEEYSPAKMQNLRKDDPDYSYFYSMLEEIKMLNQSNKRKLNTVVMKELNNLINEQEASEEDQ